MPGRTGEESGPRVMISGRRVVAYATVLGASGRGATTGEPCRTNIRIPTKSPTSASTLTPDAEPIVGSRLGLYQVPPAVIVRHLTAGETEDQNVAAHIIGMILSSCSAGDDPITANGREDSQAHLPCQGKYRARDGAVVLLIAAVLPHG
jgi:hypothetical protein